jgi:uncharacterized protein (DUF4415 family)
MKRAGNNAINEFTNPDWTGEFNGRIRQAKEDLQQTGKIGRRVRGSQKAPKKVRISMRLSPEVFEFFKAGGRGWQTRLDEALKEWTRDRMQFSEM